MNPPGPPPTSGIAGFGRGQLGRLARLVELARELTGEFYALGVEEARRIPYEVRTLAHLDQDEIRRRGVLADIARYEYREPSFGRKRDLYRVNLQDHNILHSLRRRQDGVPFSPLLLYVPTHEIVHVIRFVKFLAPFHLGLPERGSEERRVHEITRKILARVPLPGMEKVLSRYRQEDDER